MVTRVVVTVRTYVMADCPFAEAAADEQARWSVFGETGDTVRDGETGFLLTDVSVAKPGTLTALEAAVRKRLASKITDRKRVDVPS
jgi:hypothetical protein